MKVPTSLSRMILLCLTMSVTGIMGKDEVDSDTSFILKKLNDMSNDIASIRSLLNEKQNPNCDCSTNSFPSVSPTQSLVTPSTSPSSFMAPTAAPSLLGKEIATIRIMPLGDALTKGQNSFPGGYRKSLWFALKAKGYNIDFVGNNKFNGAPGIDRDHQGTGGTTIRFHRNFAQQFLDGIEYPDVILLHIGTNDFGKNDDIDNAIQRYNDLIQHISSLRPYSHIIATTLIDRTQKGINDSINSLFNPFVEDIVNKNAEEGIRVSFLDMNKVVHIDQLVDGIHPNGDGYDEMGLAWADAIQQVIGPNGDTYPPKVISAQGSAYKNEIVIEMSKPIADVSVNDISNFKIGHGISVLEVHLDSSKRNIIISTSDLVDLIGQSINVVIIGGVMDRTTKKLPLSAYTSASFTIPGLPTQTPTLAPLKAHSIRIMPFGGTLTKGENSYPGGYRKRVYQVLTSEGWNIDFVGSKTSNGAPNMDLAHEGTNNKKILFFSRFADFWFDKIDYPDIILLHVGTQDFEKQSGGFETAINRYDELIKKLAGLRPLSHIIATNLIAKGTKPGNSEIKKYFNPFIEDIVNKNAKNGVRISYLNIRQYIQADQVVDDSLLNQEGYDAMADGWIDAIKKVFTPQGVKTNLML